MIKCKSLKKTKSLSTSEVQTDILREDKSDCNYTGDISRLKQEVYSLVNMYGDLVTSVKEREPQIEKLNEMMRKRDEERKEFAALWKTASSAIAKYEAILEKMDDQVKELTGQRRALEYECIEMKEIVDHYKTENEDLIEKVEARSKCTGGGGESLKPEIARLKKEITEVRRCNDRVLAQNVILLESVHAKESLVNAFERKHELLKNYVKQLENDVLVALDHEREVIESNGMLQLQLRKAEYVLAEYMTPTEQAQQNLKTRGMMGICSKMADQLSAFQVQNMEYRQENMRLHSVLAECHCTITSQSKALRDIQLLVEDYAKHNDNLPISSEDDPLAQKHDKACESASVDFLARGETGELGISQELPARVIESGGEARAKMHEVSSATNVHENKQLHRHSVRDHHSDSSLIFHALREIQKSCVQIQTQFRQRSETNLLKDI